jgi:hypothetical protein
MITNSGIRFDYKQGLVSNMNRYYSSILCMGIALILFGFMGACDPKDKGIVGTFPHKPHIEQELTCDMCHEMDSDIENGITMPLFGVCLTCHEEGDDVFSKCDQCHKEKNVKPTEDSIYSHKPLYQKFLSKDWQDVKYDHSALDEESDCLACHQGIAKSEFSSIENLPTMKVSMDVHEEMGEPNDCEKCHIALNKWTKPETHNSRWNETHGRLMVFQEKDSCLLCHEEETCFTCHSIEKPKNHTNLWRRKTHGIQASFDRSRCMVCHRTDQCIVCHQSTASPIPASSYHTPDASCLTCHSPLASQGPSPRPPQRMFKPMPHRMMMGVSGQKCFECHQF